MDISCLVCNAVITIPEYFDLHSYDGQLSCPSCKALHHIRLAGGKVRTLELANKPSAEPKAGAPAAGSARVTPMTSTGPARRYTEANPSLASLLAEHSEEAANNTEAVAHFNPLRDFLASYRATQIHLAFEQIEAMIEAPLPTEAHTFKSWWANNRRNPQAIAWLDSGWEVFDVDLQQKGIVLRRIGAAEA